MVLGTLDSRRVTAFHVNSFDSSRPIHDPRFNIFLRIGIPETLEFTATAHRQQRDYDMRTNA